MLNHILVTKLKDVLFCILVKRNNYQNVTSEQQVTDDYKYCTAILVIRFVVIEQVPTNNESNQLIS